MTESPRTLAVDNLEFAVLKHIVDVLSGHLAEAKAEHLARLTDAANDGASKWTITLGGDKVGTVTLSQRAGAAKIVDEAAVVRAIAAEHPDMVEQRLKPWAAKQILDNLVDVTEDGGVTPEGEVLPGIVMTAPGAPYQSLTWAKDKGDTRGDEAGRRVLNDALRSGQLSAILEAAGLPAIGATE